MNSFTDCIIFYLGENASQVAPRTKCVGATMKKRTRGFLYTLKMLWITGERSVFVRTVDTDVLVILIAQFHTLSSIWPGLSFWVTFGMEKNFQLLSVNTICEYLGEQKCRALPFFHAFTGCDTSSAFLGKGKKSAWEAWNAYAEATEAFPFRDDSPFHPLEINTPVFQ